MLLLEEDCHILVPTNAVIRLPPHHSALICWLTEEEEEDDGSSHSARGEKHL